MDKTLILGLGNTIMGDDAIGILVAQVVYQTLLKLGYSGVEFKESSFAGWRLIDLISGYKKLILIDAIHTGGVPGDYYRIEWSKNNSLHLNSSHGMDLNTALELARKMGIKIPEEISLYGIEVKNPYEFKEGISEEIANKIPQITQGIIQEEFALKCTLGP